tara:strand:+ start:129 stop:1670 length:1542 start_codon:yes stop_codon:yes gene_type:complete
MTLDELLLEWSYRSERGYPSLDNPSDVSVLKTILERLDLPVDEIIDKLPEGLSPQDLRKPASFGPFVGQTRAEILIRKIENDEPLELQAGGSILVANKKEVIDALKGTISKSIPLTGTKGEISSTNKLKKTIELGTSKAAAGTTDARDPVVDTDTKEELVIVMYNILKENGKLTNFNDNKDYINNFKIINNSTTKYQDVGDKAKGKIEELFNLIGGLEKPLTKVKHVLNNPYSIAKEILKTYPNARFERDEVFDAIRLKCSGITGLPADKWNPGDVYIVNSEPNIEDLDDDSIVPWNELFVNTWGATDAPLVSVSLKEEKHQLGRAKSYLNKYANNKQEFNIAAKDLAALSTKELEDGIRNYRNQVRQAIKEEGFKVEYTGDGWENFPTKESQLRAKYGSYKLLNFLLNKSNDASIIGLFAYGLSIDRDERANPTFFKLVGGNKGEMKKKVKYPAGVNSEMDEDTPIVMEDRATNGNIKISGTIIKTDGDDFEEKEDTFKVLRMSGAGQIQIV